MILDLFSSNDFYVEDMVIVQMKELEEVAA